MAVTKPIKMGNVELERLERQGTRKFLCVLQTIDFKRLNKGQIIISGTPEEIKEKTHTNNLRDAFFVLVGDENE